MQHQHLVDRLVDALRHIDGEIEVDLESDPPVLVAHGRSGRIFAAAWMQDEGLVVRMRLDEDTDHDRLLEHVEGGDLTYETVIRSEDDVESLEQALARSERLSEGRSSN